MGGGVKAKASKKTNELGKVEVGEKGGRQGGGE